MREKNIKRMVTRQLKKKFPDWNRMTRKKKKALAKEVLDYVAKDEASGAVSDVPLNELIGTPAIRKAEIMTLTDMEGLMSNVNQNIFFLPVPSRKAHLKDLELCAIDKILDNSMINALLAPEGYTPSKRLLLPAHCLRAELLKSLKYPELSYRKYCRTQINCMDHKENRVFVGLSLRKKETLDHSQLSQFRLGLTFSQMVNIMVYIIHLFLKSGRLDSKTTIHGVDSTELPAICNPRPLATFKIGKKKVKIYADLDADCGKRRKKRDKSEYFVGYRMHSLTAIDVQSGQSYPIISLIAPANHHDSLFLPQLVALGKAIGLPLQIVTADEAYGVAEQNESIQKEQGVTVITPPKENVKRPESIESETQAVYIDPWCETPMRYLGRIRENAHEFKCDAEAGTCQRETICLKFREIAVDAGIFGQIPDQVNGVEAVKDIRKHIERPFNLLKHREGLEPIRVRSQQGVMAVATFATMANLLLEIVATRKTKRKETPQQKLNIAA